LGSWLWQKQERSAVTTEFFINAIHVMAGANALEMVRSLIMPAGASPDNQKQFSHFHNYVALPRSEAFRIEYWALEERAAAHACRSGFSRKIAFILGGASGIGRRCAALARKGAHLVIADFDETGAQKSGRA